jgi:hypothetical protein
MAKTSSKQNGAGTGVDRAVRAIERLGIVVGALAANQFGDVDLAKKSKRLRRMGFSNVEIASMLGSTPNSVAVSLPQCPITRSTPKLRPVGTGSCAKQSNTI